MKVTAKLLKRIGACEKRVERFNKAFPEGIDTSDEKALFALIYHYSNGYSFKLQRKGFIDLMWFNDWIMGVSFYRAFHHITLKEEELTRLRRLEIRRLIDPIDEAVWKRFEDAYQKSAEYIEAQNKAKALVHLFKKYRIRLYVRINYCRLEHWLKKISHRLWQH